MAVQTLSFPLSISQTTPDFLSSTVNTDGGGGDTWVNRWPGVGYSLTAPTPTNASLSINVTINSDNSAISLVEIGVDISEYSLIRATAARLKFTPYFPGAGVSNDLFGGSSTYDSVGITSQRESVRGVNVAANDYYEMYDGVVNGTEFSSSRVALASLVHATEATIPFNAAGVSYINTAFTKADLKRYLYFTMAFGGEIDAQTPNLTYSSGQGESVSISAATFEIDVDDDGSSNRAIEIGGASKMLVGAKINISGAWKPVADIQVNVGDVWKDFA